MIDQPLPRRCVEEFPPFLFSLLHGLSVCVHVFEEKVAFPEYGADGQTYFRTVRIILQRQYYILEWTA